MVCMERGKGVYGEGEWSVWRGEKGCMERVNGVYGEGESGVWRG